ncbi:MAG: amino acid permease [Solirubrobacterales bacterium]|nr:amino acid permease [Solirubrobacterales bacterium]
MDAPEDQGWGGEISRRTLGSPVLFAVVYASLAAGVYFSLGVVADYALGLTPVIFLVGALLFGLAAMTYVEGASLHQDRGGSTVFARYAFNELWSFIAGWAILLDYVILIAVCAVSATNYAAAFYDPLGEGYVELALSLAIVAGVALGAIRGFSARRIRRLAFLVVADLVLQVGLIILGLATFFSFDVLTAPIDLGVTPTWEDLIFALGVATVVLIGLESASGLSGEVGVDRRGLRRLVTTATGSVAVVYVGIALVALTAVPVVDGKTALRGDDLVAPVLGITRAFEQQWLADSLTYVFAAAAVLTLIEAAASAMLGLSRLGYSLALNRQIPSGMGRLHPTFGTPFILIGAAGVIAGALVLPQDVDFLVGLYAFGALIGLMLAHLSIIRLRYTEPDRPRPYAMPFSVRFRGASLPLPAVLGAGLAILAFASVLGYHEGARYVGVGWMAAGLALYVIYRTTQEKPLTKRVTVRESALRMDREELEELGAFGTILVPIFGNDLDDDIMQTAGRLAGETHDDFDSEEGALIEALWIFEIPMSLPIDARLPEERLKRARAALGRAKAVGEEYHGVEVATATVRARSAGRAIVDEAQRRGVEAIVLAAEEPTQIRGGALLGGRGGANEGFAGAITKYVLAKATCQVILTAPAAREQDAQHRPTPETPGGDLGAIGEGTSPMSGR